MTLLTREAIFASDDLKSETIKVEQWGGEVIVRALSGKERDAFEQSLFKGDGDARAFSAENVRANLVARCLVDGKGARLFTDADVTALGERSAAALDLLYDVAQRLSGIGKKDLEQAVKN